MLKIKDSVPLTELEKFGFVLREYTCNNETLKCYRCDSKDDMSVSIMCESGKKIFYKERFLYMDGIEYCDFEVPTIVFDLIKADLVEKVENE